MAISFDKTLVVAGKEREVEITIEEEPTYRTVYSLYPDMTDEQKRRVDFQIDQGKLAIRSLTITVSFGYCNGYSYTQGILVPCGTDYYIAAENNGLIEVALKQLEEDIEDQIKLLLG